MAIEIEGALAFTEADLPEIVVTNNYSYPLAETTDGEWCWDIADEDEETALQAVKANLAYWLWRKRNPDLVKPVDQETVNQLVVDIQESDADDVEDIAAFLVRNGWTKG